MSSMSTYLGRAGLHVSIDFVPVSASEIEPDLSTSYFLPYFAVGNIERFRMIPVQSYGRLLLDFD